MRLRPISPEDRESIHDIAMDPVIWRYFVSLVETEEDFDVFFQGMVADHAAGRRVVFHITDKTTGRCAGSTSFGNLSEADSRLEIGWSWLGVDFQGRGINRWAKYLLLEHAFENLGAERVEFKTDQLNAQAQGACATSAPWRRASFAASTLCRAAGAGTLSTTACCAVSGRGSSTSWPLTRR